MLIKIDKGRYVNTEYIAFIQPSPETYSNSPTYRLYLSSDFMITVPEHIATYIIAFMEPNEGLLDESLTTNQPQPQLSLPSRIAIFVRDHPEGVQLYDLQEQFPHELNDELAKAINTLLRENVLVTDGIVYQHKATAGSATALISDTPPDTW